VTPNFFVFQNQKTITLQRFMVKQFSPGKLFERESGENPAQYPLL
jgi:hypothetical protein